MQHLETERIAAFDHDAPNTDELAHLAACTICRAERNAFSALSQRSMHMADAPVFPPAPRLTNWESLSQRLRAEGLMTGSAPSTSFAPALEPLAETNEPVSLESWVSRVKPRTRVEWWRAAAAVLILAGGSAAVGAVSATRGFAPSTQPSATEVTAGFTFGLSGPAFNSVAEASKALDRTEKDFDRISRWLTANDPSGNTADILRRRLAALDKTVLTSYEAWQSAPTDRVLEHYYRSAYASRELTLQQLGVALPVGQPLKRF